MDVQKIATRIFIYSSLCFGILGVLMVALFSEQNVSSDVRILLTKALTTLAFVILSSFAVSFAGKYLMNHANKEKE